MRRREGEVEKLNNALNNYMSNSTSEFLDKLTSLKNDVKVFVPSVGKECVAAPLTLKQQKDIISTTVNGVLGALQFNHALNKIIIDNVEGEQFYSFDRVSIILGLRASSLGDKVKAENGDIVSINTCIENAKNVPKFKLEKKVSIDTIKVSLRIPTLEQENQIIKKCIFEVDKIETAELSKAMGLIYIFEILKHIESVSIGEQTVVFNDIKVQDRVKIVEKLPLELYEKITTFLYEINKFDRSVLKVDETQITLDATLFDATAVV